MLRHWPFLSTLAINPARPLVIHSAVMETTGCGTAIVTPFTADGSIDEPALRALVNWQIDSGIDFLVACGSTGEAATLEEEEWLFAIQVVADAAALARVRHVGELREQARKVQTVEIERAHEPPFQQ